MSMVMGIFHGKEHRKFASYLDETNLSLLKGAHNFTPSGYRGKVKSSFSKKERTFFDRKAREVTNYVEMED